MTLPRVSADGSADPDGSTAHGPARWQSDEAGPVAVDDSATNGPARTRSGGEGLDHASCGREPDRRATATGQRE